MYTIKYRILMPVVCITYFVQLYLIKTACTKSNKWYGADCADFQWVSSVVLRIYYISCDVMSMYGHTSTVVVVARIRINLVRRLPILLVVSWTAKNEYISLSPFVPTIRSRETGSAVPSRVSLLIISILRLNLVLTHGIPPEFRGGVHLFL